MKTHNPLFYLLFLTVPLFSLGCSTVDHKEYFETYEQEFKAKTNFNTHSVKRDEFFIHAKEFGKPNQHPSIIMMHGFPDSTHLYDRLVPELMSDRHIITFDFIGWGESAKPNNHQYNVASMRRDIETVITHFNLETVVFVLHDASGPPGIDWALDNQDKIAALVLLNTYYSPMPTLVAPEAIALFSTPGIRRDISVIATRYSDSLWLSRYKAQIAKFISTEELREHFQKILGYQSLEIKTAFHGLNHVLLKEVEKRKDNIPLLKQFKPPVRIIFGKDDPYLNTGVAQEFHKLFSNSELFLVENGGHFVQIDRPKQVAELIQKFPTANKH